MSLHVRAAPPEHVPWLLNRVQVAPTPGFRAIEALDDNGLIRGMVGFDSWTENSVQIHIAIESKGALKALVVEDSSPAFSYPFEQSAKGVLLAVIRSDNKKSLTLTAHCGFRQTHLIKDGAAPGVDLVLFEMRKHECRFLKTQHRRAA